MVSLLHSYMGRYHVWLQDTNHAISSSMDIVATSPLPHTGVSPEVWLGISSLSPGSHESQASA
jgi:hypothetical protein